jgi:rubrerythrin
MKKTGDTETPKHAESQYERYVQHFHDILEKNQAKGREALEASMEMAREKMVALGELSVEQGKQFRSYLEKDLAQTARDMEHLGEQAKEHLHPSRVGAGALAATATALRLAGQGLLNLSAKADEALVYNSGEITSAGTLTCLKCGTTVKLNKAAVIAPCPSCAGTIFKKGY